VKHSDSKNDPFEPKKPGPEISGDEEALGAVPDLVRRAVAMGLSGFFSTEEAVRRAVGDTLPKDWTEFLADTSDRTRAEFLDRLTREIGRVLEGVDFATIIREYLDSRDLTVKAELQFRAKSDSGPKPT
jgi:hypothetical protein